MGIPGDHKSYLDRRDFPIPPGDFTEDERQMLAKYGRWLEALANGELLPVTPTQEQFVRVARGVAEPSTEFERAWVKVARSRAAKPEVLRTFDALADARARAAAVESEYRAAREAVLAQVQDQLAAVDARYGPLIQESTGNATAAEEALRAFVLRLGHSFTMSRIRAVYTAGRITWDAKKLEAYAQLHPDIRAFRKVGNPFVGLRFLDGHVLPQAAKPPSVSDQQTVRSIEPGPIASETESPTPAPMNESDFS